MYSFFFLCFISIFVSLWRHFNVVVKAVPLNVYRNSKYKDFTENKHPFVIRIWV